MSAKFPGDWVRKPRLEHVKLGIRRALDLDPNVPRTTTELWSGLALHREKSLPRQRDRYCRAVRRAAELLCVRVGRSKTGSGRPILWCLAEARTSIDTSGRRTDSSLVAFHLGREVLGNAAISGIAPTTVNSSVRTREYLTEAEIERLMAAARKGSRYGHRDATMILIGYRHGLRASELCDLQWSQVELNAGRLHVRRAKNGTPSVHPLQGDEIRALRRLQREQGQSPHVFMTERAGPMTPKAFHALFGRIGARAKMPFAIHPHMLRHGCGYALANAGHDTRRLQAYLGHKNIQHTVRYTELAPDRFKDFWR
jgi:integrase